MGRAKRLNPPPKTGRLVRVAWIGYDGPSLSHFALVPPGEEPTHTLCGKLVGPIKMQMSIPAIPFDNRFPCLRCNVLKEEHKKGAPRG